MTRPSAIAVVLAPFMVAVAYAQADVAGTAFDLSDSDFDSIRYSRIVDSDSNNEDSVLQYADRQTEFSLSVKPAKPKFSLKTGFGLNSFSQAQHAVEVESGLLGKNRLVDAIPDIHDGFAYSAGVKVEHEDADIDGTAYVSSSLLGLSYGRLGRMWYGGVDVNIEQMKDAQGQEAQDVLKVDFTTGRRLEFTGTSNDSPLWMLSLQGNLDLQDISDDNIESRGDWYLNPSLFWQHPGFTFSAQVQVPVEAPSSDGTIEPDYRLRAIFEKQF
jgi:hypothetical protein